MNARNLTQARVKELLDYEPDTGVFRWKSSRRPGHNGKIAGKTGNGTYRYAVIGIDGRNYGISQVAWLYMYGEWPSRQLRFVNGNGADARIANLALRPEGRARYRGGKPNPNPDIAEYKANADKHLTSCRKAHWKMRFGITPETYVKMLESQNGVCAICHQPETRIFRGLVSNLAVDHDHITGAVRGLLCFKCNSGIGALRDDPAVITRAAEYIKLYRMAEPSTTRRKEQAT